MNGEHIVISMRKAKYYTNDIFEPNKFFPCSEQFFDDTVVKYREQFTMKYIGRNKQLFEDKYSGLKLLRRWL